jgi:tRNA pseudouridine55 synthase
MDGILLVDKEHGISSYDVIRKIKKALGRKEKIGHAGTLDPFANGLLIVLFGRATKLQDRIHEFKKGYVANAQFGSETDTQDSMGKPTETTKKIPTKQDILDVLPNFIGVIEQKPPQYSAVKVGGQRAYKLAREGVQFELPSRKIEIYELELLRFKDAEASFRIVCSTGTYIRTLLVDLARKLGSLAHCNFLIREFTGSFKVHESLHSSLITKEGVENSIIPMDKLSEFGL